MSEKIKFIDFGTYFHGYQVEGLHDRLKKHKKDLIKEFKEEYKDWWKIGSTNVSCNIKEFNDEFAPLMYYIVKEYYLVDETWLNIPFGTYIQNKDRQVNHLHTHWHQTTISSVMYIDPLEPGEGGELEIWTPPDDPVHWTPQKDYVYFFPSWLLHRPLPQKVDKTRLCLNWGYNCSKRPIHKLTGYRW